MKTIFLLCILFSFPGFSLTSTDDKTQKLKTELENFEDSIDKREKDLLEQERFWKAYPNPATENLLKEKRQLIEESRSKIQFLKTKIADIEQMNSEEPSIFSKLKGYNQKTLFEKLSNLFQEFQNASLDLDQAPLLESTQNLIQPMMDYASSILGKDEFKTAMLLAKATHSVEKWLGNLIRVLHVNIDDAETMDVLVERVRKALDAKSKKVDL